MQRRFLLPPSNHPALDSLWINGSPASPHIILRKPGSYFLTLKSKDGCLSYDSSLIQKSSRLLSRFDSLTVCRNGSLVYKIKLTSRSNYS
ncbi:MAG: hypothetical protein IPN15_18825 [Saprospiraceae bacterium]|nr:hypothetical protein [Candidatus Vicinibacter affinis]